MTPITAKQFADKFYELANQPGNAMFHQAADELAGQHPGGVTDQQLWNELSKHPVYGRPLTSEFQLVPDGTPSATGAPPAPSAIPHPAELAHRWTTEMPLRPVWAMGDESSTLRSYFEKKHAEEAKQGPVSRYRQLVNPIAEEAAGVVDFMGSPIGAASMIAGPVTDAGAAALSRRGMSRTAAVVKNAPRAVNTGFGILQGGKALETGAEFLQDPSFDKAGRFIGQAGTAAPMLADTVRLKGEEPTPLEGRLREVKKAAAPRTAPPPVEASTPLPKAIAEVTQISPAAQKALKLLEQDLVLNPKAKATPTAISRDLGIDKIKAARAYSELRLAGKVGPDGSIIASAPPTGTPPAAQIATNEAKMAELAKQLLQANQAQQSPPAAPAAGPQLPPPLTKEQLLSMTAAPALKPVAQPAEVPTIDLSSSAGPKGVPTLKPGAAAEPPVQMTSKPTAESPASAAKPVEPAAVDTPIPAGAQAVTPDVTPAEPPLSAAPPPVETPAAAPAPVEPPVAEPAPAAAAPKADATARSTDEEAALARIKQLFGSQRGSFSWKPVSPESHPYLFDESVTGDLYTVGKMYLREFGRDIGAWSQAMVKQFGEGMKSYLEPIWDNITRDSQTPTVGPDAKPPASGPAEPALPPAPPPAIQLTEGGEKIPVTPDLLSRLQVPGNAPKPEPPFMGPTLGQPPALVGQAGVRSELPPRAPVQPSEPPPASAPRPPAPPESDEPVRMPLEGNPNGETFAEFQERAQKNLEASWLPWIRARAAEGMPLEKIQKIAEAAMKPVMRGGPRPQPPEGAEPVATPEKIRQAEQRAAALAPQDRSLAPDETARRIGEAQTAREDAEMQRARDQRTQGQILSGRKRTATPPGKLQAIQAGESVLPRAVDGLEKAMGGLPEDTDRWTVPQFQSVDKAQGDLKDAITQEMKNLGFQFRKNIESPRSPGTLDELTSKDLSLKADRGKSSSPKGPIVRELPSGYLANEVAVKPVIDGSIEIQFDRDTGEFEATKYYAHSGDYESVSGGPRELADYMAKVAQRELPIPASQYAGGGRRIGVTESVPIAAPPGKGPTEISPYVKGLIALKNATRGAGSEAELQNVVIEGAKRATAKPPEPRKNRKGELVTPPAKPPEQVAESVKAMAPSFGGVTRPPNELSRPIAKAVMSQREKFPPSAAPPRPQGTDFAQPLTPTVPQKTPFRVDGVGDYTPVKADLDAEIPVMHYVFTPANGGAIKSHAMDLGKWEQLQAKGHVIEQPSQISAGRTSRPPEPMPADLPIIDTGSKAPKTRVKPESDEFVVTAVGAPGKRVGAWSVGQKGGGEELWGTNVHIRKEKGSKFFNVLVDHEVMAKTSTFTQAQVEALRLAEQQATAERTGTVVKRPVGRPAKTGPPPVRLTGAPPKAEDIPTIDLSVPAQPEATIPKLKHNGSEISPGQ